MEDTPEQIGKMVRATFTGKGTKKILLIAHMDTVYPRGMFAKQPFRIEGDRAYGLGIADDKQGIAVILHMLAILKAMNFQQYGTLTVLINADEEISSPGSRSMISKLGAEDSATDFSVEASRTESDGFYARDRRHRLVIITHHQRPRVTLRRGTRQGYERALRARSSGASNPRFLGSSSGAENELDPGDRGHHAQHDPARRSGRRRRARYCAC